MDHESEVIKQQMEDTRSSLAEKLESLEKQVASTVLSTTEAVTGTVEAVKGAVEDTVQSVTDSVENVKESVSNVFDLRSHMNNHPWLILGGGVVVGYLGARLLERGTAAVAHESSSRAAPSVAPYAAPRPAERPAQHDYYQAQGLASGAQSSGSSGSSGPGMMGHLTEALAPVATHLQGLALGLLTNTFGRMVLDAVPDSLRGEVEKVVEEVNQAVGGKPLPAFLHDNPAQARASAPPPL